MLGWGVRDKGGWGPDESKHVCVCLKYVHQSMEVEITSLKCVLGEKKGREGEVREGERRGVMNE